jgi:AraC-like DNA-binding protein
MANLIFIGSIFLVFLTIYMLLFSKNAAKSYADYVLSILLLVHCWSVILFLILYSEYILLFPHVFKTGLPLNFLIAPCSYLYVRAVLLNEKKFQKRDVIHLIPFFIVLINYIPFYLLPVNEKVTVIQNSLNYWPDTFKYQAGFLPENFSILFRLILAIIYLVLQWNLILSYKKVHKESSIQIQISNVLKWLKLFTITSTVIFFGIIGFMLTVFFLPSYYNDDLLMQIPSLLVSVGFFVMAAYLLTHPEILSGLPFVKYKEVPSDVINDKSYMFSYINEDYKLEMERIVDYFKTEKPYLNKDLNINQVSVALAIPSRELSFIINNHFGQRFNDFLNKYRIEYITKKINKEYLSNYTIEGIASEAGFASKSTFNLAFKKYHQCTPTEYFSKF